MVRVGVVGYGWVAGAHIDAINSINGAEVVAVCSERNLDASELSVRHGRAMKVYRTLEDMLGDADVSVVSICSYPNLHSDQVIMAASAGKHLIIEKPLALNQADLERVAEAITKAGVSVCVCFECRYSSQFIATKSLIDEGLLGTIHYGEIDYYHGIGPWYGQFRWNIKSEVGGSSLLSAGCHALDALLLCMGDNVEEVFALSSKSRNAELSAYEYDSTSVAVIKFSDGRIGKVASSIDCLQPYYFHVHLLGSEGSLLDNKFHSQKIAGLNRGAWSSLSMKMLDSGDVSDHPYRAQFQAFFDSLGSKMEMPLTGLREAMKTHRVIFAVEESLKTGRPVRVENR